MKSAIDLALDITQGFFGEPATYTYSDLSTSNINALFERRSVEVNGVQGRAMTCEIVASHLTKSPAKGDQITRGAKTWNVGQDISENEEILILILKDT